MILVSDDSWPVGYFLWRLKCQYCGDEREQGYFRGRSVDVFGARCDSEECRYEYRDHDIVGVVDR